ncbi:MAG: UDP-N-acetylmuramoyl-L-alanine--D-glutamate ligase [Patescibacteria group bacterium]
MKPTDFKGKRITIMGLGTLGGGAGVVKYLLKTGAKLTVTDLRTKKELFLVIKKLGSKNINYVLGKHREQDFKNVDLVIKNPAVPSGSKYLKIARKNKIPVESDASLFFQLCRVPIIGVTGTKGKTTTVSIVESVLKKSGRHFVIVGHNQTSVLDRLSLIKKDSIVIFELSSWRLEILKDHRISPHVAVVTNVKQDHLNTYHGMKEYAEAKSNIFKYQKNNDFVILNKENSYTRKFGESVVSKRYWFSKKYFTEENGIFVKNGKIVFRNMGTERAIMPLDLLRVKGDHNLENILAAVATLKIIGIPDKFIKLGAENFKGVQDRLEFLRKLKGKEFCNDSAATIPDATVAAIKSFNGNLILIAGGVDKQLNYNQMAIEIKKRVTFLSLLPGSATEKLKPLLIKKKVKFIESESLKRAVDIAYKYDLNDATILFSPGAASFNMFKNEFDRGEKFRIIVKGLK